MKNTAIYFCDKIHNNSTDLLDISRVKNFAKSNLQISEIWDSKSIPVFILNSVVKMLKDNNIERVILAGHQPGFVKPFFTRALVETGGNPENILLASFRENGAITSKDTDLAKAIVACAYYNIPFDLAASTDKVNVNPETLIIGAGIAGIQAAIEIANGNEKIYLLEKSGTIGGHMALFDKTFPTLDCAACILTPKMVDVGQHENIEMLTYSEVKEVSGSAGNYMVKILKKTRRVNLDTCIGCGTCAEKCPGITMSEFDVETTTRSSIYIPFAQAVPNKYLVDENSCTYLMDPYIIMGNTAKKIVKDGVPQEIADKIHELKKIEIGTEKKFIEVLNEKIGEEATEKYKDIIFKYTGKCRVCEKVCPVDGCIDLDDKDEIIELNVGNIILSTGFQVFDAKRIKEFGYGKYPNVLTSLEFERLVNASGPTSGNIRYRTKDKKDRPVFVDEGATPKSYGIIHCVGSRDRRYNSHCSKVCCMYSLKLAHLIREKVPDADIYEYYIDMRCFGKDYEEFYNRIKTEDANIIRGRTSNIEQIGDKLHLRTEDIENGRMLEHKVDMVILSVGLEPAKGSEKLAKMLGLKLEGSGWFKELNATSDPVNTNIGGVTIAGLCHGPKDIPDTVVQASAAASRVLQSILIGKINKSIKELSMSDIESKAKYLSTT